MAKGRRLRVVFLAQRVPYPPTRGDKIITWRMLQRLHEAHEVTCIAFVHGRDDAAGAAELRRLGIDIVTVPYRPVIGFLKSLKAIVTEQPLTTTFLVSSRVQAELRSRMHRTDVAVAFSSSMGAYLLDWPSVPRILHFCELDSDKWLQYAQRTAAPMRWIYARESRVLLTLERRLAAKMNANLVCTPLERSIFESRIPGSSTGVMPNGVDLEYFSPKGLQPERGHLVFTGVMNYFPNVDGCEWLVREVLPKVIADHPQVKLTIVGSNPSRAVTRLTRDSHVMVTGAVLDTRSYVRRAAIVVAPIRIARGIQNKVLEGLAMGVPVVATSAAVQGVGGIANRDYVVADDVVTMAAAISNLLSRDEERTALGARGRAFVESHYSWDRSLGIFDEVMASVLSEAHSDGSEEGLRTIQSREQAVSSL